MGCTLAGDHAATARVGGAGTPTGLKTTTPIAIARTKFTGCPFTVPSAYCCCCCSRRRALEILCFGQGNGLGRPGLLLHRGIERWEVLARRDLHRDLERAGGPRPCRCRESAAHRRSRGRWPRERAASRLRRCWLGRSRSIRSSGSSTSAHAWVAIERRPQVLGQRPRRDVATDLPAGQAQPAQQREHDVREVLAHPLPGGQRFFDRRIHRVDIWRVTRSRMDRRHDGRAVVSGSLLRCASARASRQTPINASLHTAKWLG